MKKIKKTIIVANDSRKSGVSVVGRAAIGVIVLGPIGLLAGATGKNKQTTTFQIIYEDSTQETKVVNNNSKEFKEYCKYLYE